MFTATAPDFLAVVNQLPPGTSFRADNVSWETYERLLADLSPFTGVRVFYDQGRMEAVSPTSSHEKPVEIIATLVRVFRDQLDVDVESLGSTTLRLQIKAKGAEPDASFFVQHAAQVIGKADLKLPDDPPPDLIVESDLTSSSLDRFAIYAGLDVPEIWRVANWHVSIWLLNDGAYQEAEVSAAFPFLARQTLNEFLVKGLNEGERKVARAMREWLENQPSSSSQS
jgi:Uma2 family endonuclease